jgi:urease accessory protein
VHVRMERDGLAVLREAGSAKCRMPRGTTDAILINTSGGLAGGDAVHITADVGAGAALTLTSQAAERIYRTLGPAADVNVTLTVRTGARLFWLPQESIFFEGSSLSRSLNVTLDEDATFLAVEPMVFGRTEMGERVKLLSVVDHWDVKQDGKLVHAERFRLGPLWPNAKAAFADNLACATVLLMSPNVEARLDPVRQVLRPDDGASCWNGKLVARLVARDGFHLRKTLFQVLCACVGREAVPYCWTF